ncbi:uncharacterized protein [Montipora foliosa]|uniref:uncharacterized protein n=1 Tax=Montipora foliosa TaxID=591990 RepID=UPI0035F106FD
MRVLLRGRAFVVTGSLLISAVLFVASGNRCPNPEDIELFNPKDRSKYECWSASAFDCPEGYERSVKLGSVHPTGTDLVCNLCPEGSYSNFMTNNTCMKCTPCGNNKVQLNCTVIQDRVCSSIHCISNKFYLNTTDNQCYPCSICCGSNSDDIVPECLRSGDLRVGVTVIGQKGGTHCGVKSSQQCDDLNVSKEKNNLSYVHVCNTEYHVIIEIILGVLFTISICMVAYLMWYIKGRGSNCQQSSQNAFTRCFEFCFSSSSLGGGFELNLPFKERIKLIPENVKIENIPYDVEEFICGLDANKPHSKNWYHVGRKLGVSTSQLDLLRREDVREGGSPTNALLSVLRTEENVISLRAFVQAIHDISRNDIVNNIIDFYRSQQTNSETVV